MAAFMIFCATSAGIAGVLALAIWLARYGEDASDEASTTEVSEH